MDRSNVFRRGIVLHGPLIPEEQPTPTIDVLDYDDPYLILASRWFLFFYCNLHVGEGF